ncbi:transcriptional regulator with XRE-family HTH domain [Rhizobium leguminosarum]|uniref:helix-turn-helix domain-containing protein n=1 Tax=Rhizobium leguminosarum TaxID=384 RepID=UPI00161DBC0A|nr:helix-turn-helix transcriptional regulator [Rhizobium leguminosarum]MBB5664759.1 transcriptional regulator with XRE-family HTH domain [Rhizobium leguminosarum]
MFDLKAQRLSLNLTQQEMALAMGMPLRSYQDIESGKNPVRPVHEAAANYAAYVIRTKARVKGTKPPHFFIVRFKSHEGEWSHTWSVYAEDFADAVERFYNLARVDRTAEIQIKGALNGFIPNHSVNHAEAVLEHRDVPWPD